MPTGNVILPFDLTRLSRRLAARLAGQGLTVLEARQVPPNDGGISLGQAWVAVQQLAGGT